jgi:hypothetical protein
VAGTNLTSPCPVILLEANYLGENLIGDGSSAITYRKQPWWLILAGGLGGYIFGTAWTWNFPLGWQSHMADGVSDVQTWLAFLKSINWWTLQPDFGRALATTGSTGWNSAASGVSIGNPMRYGDWVIIAAFSPKRVGCSCDAPGVVGMVCATPRRCEEMSGQCDGRC